MAKTHWKPGTIIYPLPAVMVSCGHAPEECNILTISWTGTINSDPPMCAISVRPQRHSYEIIRKTGEFVINLTTEKLAKATDWCGCNSGRKFNKWEMMKLTPAPAQIVKVPLIKESPVNIECVVKDCIELGTHHMFIADVVSVSVDEGYMNAGGAFNFAKIRPLVYGHGHYYGLGRRIGKFGWSVQKKNKNKPKQQQ